MKTTEKKEIRMVYIQSKDCKENSIELDALQDVVKRISSVLQFSASDGFRISFDVLADADCSASPDPIQCLIDHSIKNFKQEIAAWVVWRLKLLQRLFVRNSKIIIPLCLTNLDEIARRLLLGVLYVTKCKINTPMIIDDSMTYIGNETYIRAYFAVTRPYLRILNRYPVQEELLSYNPIILTPGGQAGYYRLAHPTKYTIIFDSNRWQIDRKIIEKMADSL
jgi:hypothetical protein